MVIRPLTVHTIDLYKIALHRFTRVGRMPVDCNIVCLDTCERDIGSVRDLDSQYTDQFGDRFPEGEPCSVEKPRRSCQYVVQGVVLDFQQLFGRSGNQRFVPLHPHAQNTLTM